MKNITQKQIDILVEAIVKKIYDRKKMNEELEKQQQEAITKYKKTAEYKNIEKIFKDNPMINSIDINKRYFFGETQDNNYYFDSRILASKWEADIERIIKDKVSSDFRRDIPEEYTIRNQVREELTIRVLGWEDIRQMMEDLTKEFKSKYNL